MRSSFLVMFLVITCCLGASPLISMAAVIPSPGKSVAKISNLAKMEEEILFYINDYRVKKGLAVLQMNAHISLEAQKHSADMASNKMAFGHDGFEDRVKLISKKIGTMRASAENVAYGNLSPREVADIWLKSPGHRKNIKGKYTLTGIGTATAKNDVIFFTQIFATK